MKESMNDKLSDALTDVDDGYIVKTARPPMKTKNLWIRVGAIAACLALVLSIPLGILMQRDPIPDFKNAHYSAEDIGGLFSGTLSSGGTTNYTEVYVPDPAYLYRSEIPAAEYLPVYREYDVEPDRESFQRFIDDHLQGVSEVLGLENTEYRIEQHWNGLYDAYFEEKINFYQNRWLNGFSMYSYASDDSGIVLNGKTVTADQTKSDEEIIQSLSGIREELKKMFGRDFPDAKVIRNYSDRTSGVSSMYVYFYDESAHLLDSFIDRMPYSDHITLAFEVSDHSLMDCYQIHYFEFRADLSEIYKTISFEKVISLETAEKLLNAGYTFGGHSCKICMSNQDEVDFSDYDIVGMTYIFGGSGRETGIPFYVFYKQIGTVENGNLIYARTYVPAIEVSGLKAYFKSQEKVHKSKFWWE